MNKAEEFLKAQDISNNVMLGDKNMTIIHLNKLLEDYLQSRVNARSDEDLANEYSNSVTIRIHFINSIKFFKTKLLKQ